ncbi:acetate uptake transporter [Glutamicibacter arilaitensis]|uniref:acetate uptake transporter n=1 Tax=Glutamicibacter arilaitensis TaxID=256701 RepID=UPI003A90B3BC
MTALLTREDTADIAALPEASKPGLADPAALGLGAFALTTFALSLSNAGIIPEAGAAVLAIALFYGGLVQLIAGVIEFVKGNVFGATAFTSYGAFWMAFWWLETNPEVAEAAGSAGLGAFLLGWTIFTIYMTIAALRTNGVLVAVFTVLTAAFICLTLGAFTGSTLIHELGGWLGLVTAFLAWYGSCAIVTNATWGRQVLPMWAK